MDATIRLKLDISDIIEIKQEQFFREVGHGLTVLHGDDLQLWLSAQALEKVKSTYPWVLSENIVYMRCVVTKNYITFLGEVKK